MQLSYSNNLIRFTLNNWLDIKSGCVCIDKMAEFTKSAGRKNPTESALIWAADIDRAIDALSHGEWLAMVRDLGHEGLRDQAQKLPRVQRIIVLECIFAGCPGCPKPMTCANGGIISKMRRWLNGEPEPPPRTAPRIKPLQGIV